MVTIQRIGILFGIALLTIGSDLGPARAASGGCTNNPASAINQYCETIPAATGAQQPALGSPVLANTVPPRILREITSFRGSALGGSTPRAVVRARANARRLLALPAPAGRHDVPQARASISGGSVWSMALTMILILVAIAIAMSCAALLRRRRRRELN